VSQVERIAERLALILVISVRGQTRLRRDYDAYSVAASFLSSIELDDILISLRSKGIYVEHLADETEFISWYCNGGFDALPRPIKLVYTSAVNGTGPGRRCLVPAFCSLEGIPTVNSDAYSCAINRHKFHWNKLLGSFGYPVPRCWSYSSETGWFRDEKPRVGTHIIAKATFEGSSIGLRPSTVGIFEPAMELRLREVSCALGQPMTVQELIVGDEFEVPVIEATRNIAPLPISVLRSDGARLWDAVLTYDDVWIDQYKYAAPTNFAETLLTKLRESAVGACDSFPFRGFSRIDFRVDASGRPFIIDVSSTPHLTRSSSFAFLFELMGFSYADMLLALVATGARRHGHLESQ
jgi:D-alanine-D-alanine ligase